MPGMQSAKLKVAWTLIFYGKLVEGMFQFGMAIGQALEPYGVGYLKTGNQETGSCQKCLSMDNEYGVDS